MDRRDFDHDDDADDASSPDELLQRPPRFSVEGIRDQALSLVDVIVQRRTSPRHSGYTSTNSPHKRVQIEPRPILTRERSQVCSAAAEPMSSGRAKSPPATHLCAFPSNRCPRWAKPK
eukprot:6726673-Prymnesium_polylepis.1